MDGRRRIKLGPAVVLALLLAAPGVALAHDPPEITGGPTLTGIAQVGQKLSVTATWISDPEATAKWIWQRCETPAATCTAIANAKTATYELVAADEGKYVRARLTLTNIYASVQSS